MNTRRLGNSSLQLSAIGLGTWAMGGGQWGGTDDDASIRTIHRALELGVTYIDTAEAYGGGHSESVVGAALVGRRQDVIISTKAAPSHLSPTEMRAALDRSMERLKTDYVDLYFIHWPNYDQPIAETIDTLEALRHEGRIRAIGVSNFTVELMQKALQAGTIDALQPPYNLIWRFIERDVLPFCRANGIGITTYSSLAQGILTGTLALDTKFPEGDIRPQTVLFQPEHYASCLAMVEQLRPIAQAMGVTLPQLALRWVLEQPGITSSLVGARLPSEIEENVGALGWAMQRATLAQLQQHSDGLFETFGEYPDMWFNWQSWNKPRPQK